MTETSPTPTDTILIVESDILVRAPLAEYLRECGYKVIESSSPGEARLVLQAGGVRIDTLFANVDAGAESGFSLAAWLRVNHPAIEVVLAGTVGRAVAQAGDLCEQGPALSRPYDHAQVLDRIRRLQAARNRAGTE